MSQKDDFFDNYVPLTDSFIPAASTAIYGQRCDPGSNIEITLKLYGTHGLDVLVQAGAHFTREQLNNANALAATTLSILDSFAHFFRLTILQANAAAHTVTVHGAIADLERAFRVQLFCCQSNFRSRHGHIYIPDRLRYIVQAVLGLEDVPTAQPYFVAGSPVPMFTAPSLLKGYFAHEVGELYLFPAGVTGAGQCIGIIALGGGYRLADIHRYFAHMGIRPPAITDVLVNGARNEPSTAHSVDREVMLDIQVAGAIAPGARIVVYFAPNNDRGFFNAVTRAIHDKVNRPGIISISWGSAEKKWTRQSLKAYNEAFKTAAALGITVCAASGDAGSGDGIDDGRAHVDFPASSPYVLACGGTRLEAKNKKIISEVVWHESDRAAGGGGVSEVFPLPDYQLQANVPLSVNPSKFRGRGVPDVAGNAAHSSGYKVLVNGKQMILGGTSAVAPLYAGLIALINQASGRQAGFINPHLYNNPSFFRQIVKGNNITAHPGLGYTACKGWNACTGLGVLEDFRW